LQSCPPWNTGPKIVFNRPARAAALHEKYIRYQRSGPQLNLKPWLRHFDHPSLILQGRRGVKSDHLTSILDLSRFWRILIQKLCNVENDAKFRTFWHTVKIRRVWARSLGQLMKLRLQPDLRNTFDSRSPRGRWERCIDKLENVAIAMHCNLGPPDVAALITTPMRSLKTLNLSAAVLQRFYC